MGKQEKKYEQQANATGESINPYHRPVLLSEAIEGMNIQDDGIYGRILHLEPVTWQSDWPLMGVAGAGGIRQPVLTHKKPDVCPQAVAVPQTGDDFSGPELSPASWRPIRSAPRTIQPSLSCTSIPLAIIRNFFRF